MLDIIKYYIALIISYFYLLVYGDQLQFIDTITNIKYDMYSIKNMSKKMIELKTDLINVCGKLVNVKYLVRYTSEPEIILNGFDLIELVCGGPSVFYNALLDETIVLKTTVDEC